MASVFVDTDVILDLFIRREPHHNLSLKLFSQLRRSKTQAYTSAVVVANVYYLLAKVRSKGYALDRLRRLRRLLRVAPMDENVVDAALSAPHKDFEDSLQYQCAIGKGTKILITRNTRDFPKEKVTIATPADYLDMVAKGKDG